MAIFYPDILAHNNPNKALVDITSVRGTTYPIDYTSSIANIPSDKWDLGMIVYVTGSNPTQYLAYYGPTTGSSDWNNLSNWKSLGGVISTGSFATTGSNNFNGNQTITGSLIVNSSSVILTNQTGSMSVASSSFSISASYVPSPVTGFSNGSVLFAYTSSIAQDNSNFYYDNSNSRLGVGQNSPSSKIKVMSSTASNGQVSSGLNIPYSYADSWLAFTGVPSSGVQFSANGGSTAYVQIDLGFQISVNQYSISTPILGGGNGDYTTTPTSWTVSGSNDGANWTGFDLKSGIVWTSNSQTQTFNLSNNVYFRYFRYVTILSGSAIQSRTVGGWQLYGPPLPLAKLHIYTISGSEIGQITQRSPTQISDLSQYWNESGSVLSGINSNGRYYVSGGLSTQLLTASGSLFSLNSIVTTGSNNFNGNQTITGSLTVSGSHILIGTKSLTGSLSTSGSITVIGNEIITGSLTVSGSTTLYGSLNVTSGITSSLQGTSSYATTASYALNGGSGTGFPYTGQALISGSLTVTGSSLFYGYISTNGNLGINTNNPTTPLDVHGGVNSGNVVQVDNTTDLRDTRIALLQSGSFQWYFGNEYNSGSNNFTIWDASNAPIIVSLFTFKKNGSLTANSFTGSLFGTASYASTASYYGGSVLSSSYSTTASYVLNAVSASYANTTSYAPNYVLNSVTSSMLSPYVLTSQTGSMSVNSASYANTSSYSQQSLSSSYANTASIAPSYTTTSSFNSFTSSYSTGSFTGSFTGLLQYGQLTFTGSNVLGSLQSNVNNYNQLVLQNSNSGATASVDIVFTNNSGSDFSYYGDIGMNSSGFVGSSSFSLPNAIFFGAANGDLTLGTYTSNAIHIVVSSSNVDSLYINSSGSVFIPSASLTGSLQGSASYASTSSYAPNYTLISATGSFATTGSNNFNGNQTITGSLSVGTSIITTAAAVTSNLGSNTIFTQATGSHTSAFYKYTFTSQSNARAGEVMAIWNGTSVQFTDNSTPDIGNTLAVTSSVSISGANVILSTYTPSAGWTINSQVTYI